MCSTKILARSKQGFISLCKQCQSIHVAFGTALLTFESEEYTQFCRFIEEDIVSLQHAKNNEAKCVQIPHPASARISVVLSRTEIQDLNTLTQEANLLLTCYNLLNNAS